MTPLTETDKQHVIAMLHSPGWKIFESYVQRQLEMYSELYPPNSIASFFEREQQLGKHELLRNLITDFVQSTK